ncbi:MAG: cupin domain-containing protein [Nitrospiria bacterium]
MNNPGTVHAPHVHDYNKTLFCIEGEISFSFPDLGISYTLYPGDRLIVPAGLRHSALVSSRGVTCVEGKAT